jgi:hypothetical protein
MLILQSLATTEWMTGCSAMRGSQGCGQRVCSRPGATGRCDWRSSKHQNASVEDKGDILLRYLMNEGCQEMRQDKI